MSLRIHVVAEPVRFVLLVKPDESLSDVAAALVRQHRKLYGRAVALPSPFRLRDAQGSDMSLDYRVGDVCDRDAVLHVVAQPQGLPSSPAASFMPRSSSAAAATAALLFHPARSTVVSAESDSSDGSDSSDVSIVSQRPGPVAASHSRASTPFDSPAQRVVAAAMRSMRPRADVLGSASPDSSPRYNNANGTLTMPAPAAAVDIPANNRVSGGGEGDADADGSYADSGDNGDSGDSGDSGGSDSDSGDADSDDDSDGQGSDGSVDVDRAVRDVEERARALAEDDEDQALSPAVASAVTGKPRIDQPASSSPSSPSSSPPSPSASPVSEPVAKQRPSDKPAAVPNSGQGVLANGTAQATQKQTPRPVAEAKAKDACPSAGNGTGAGRDDSEDSDDGDDNDDDDNDDDDDSDDSEDSGNSDAPVADGGGAPSSWTQSMRPVAATARDNAAIAAAAQLGKVTATKLRHATVSAAVPRAVAAVSSRAVTETAVEADPRRRFASLLGVVPRADKPSRNLAVRSASSSSSSSSEASSSSDNEGSGKDATDAHAGDSGSTGSSNKRVQRQRRRRRSSVAIGLAALADKAPVPKTKSRALPPALLRPDAAAAAAQTPVLELSRRLALQPSVLRAPTPTATAEAADAALSLSRKRRRSSTATSAVQSSAATAGASQRAKRAKVSVPSLAAGAALTPEHKASLEAALASGQTEMVEAMLSRV